MLIIKIFIRAVFVLHLVGIALFVSSCANTHTSTSSEVEKGYGGEGGGQGGHGGGVGR